MLLTKIFGGLSVALLAGTIILGYLYKNSLEELGRQEANIAVLEGSVSDWEKSFDDMNTLLQDTHRSAEERAQERRESQKIAREWQKRYEEAKKENEELKNWANTTAPAVVWDGLRGTIEGLRPAEERGEDSSPSAVLH